MKSCSKCKELKPLTEFSKNKRNKTDGHVAQCKSCIKEYRKNNAAKLKEQRKEYRKNNAAKIKEYYQNNADKKKEQKKEYYQNNAAKLKEQKKEYRKNNAAKIKEYYQNNAAKIKEQKKEYRKANRDTINKQITARKVKDPLFRLKNNTRSLISMSIKNNGYTKQSKTHEILGCSYQDFKLHIEQQFTEGMNWDNRHLWHLDHIIPVSLALTEEEIIALNHYTNFQPLWAEDNLSKSNNIHWTKCKDKYKQ